MTSQFRESIDRRNAQDKEHMEQSAANLRERMIDSAWDAIKNCLREEDEAFDRIARTGYPEDAVFEYKIQATNSAFPLRDEEPRQGFSMLLKPEFFVSDDSAQSEPDQSEMMVTVEVPRGTPLERDEHFDLDALPKPKCIAVRYVTPTGMVASFEIDMMGTAPFVNALDSGDETIDEDGFDEELQEATLELRQGIPSLKILDDVELIPRFFKDMVEWKTQVQRTVPVSEIYGSSSRFDQN